MTTQDIRVLKTATCQSLSGKTTLTCEIGVDGAEILARVTRSSGSGTFSKDWVALSRIHAALEKNGARPITLATLGPLFRGLSANTAGFLLAVLKHEGLVRAREDQARAYERLDGKAFFAEVAKLTGAAPAKGQAAVDPAGEATAGARHEAHNVTAGGLRHRGSWPADAGTQEAREKGVREALTSRADVPPEGGKGGVTCGGLVRGRPPQVLDSQWLCRVLAWSTNNRRINRAATAKKCARFSHCTSRCVSRRNQASWTSPVVWRVCPSPSLRSDKAACRCSSS